MRFTRTRYPRRRHDLILTKCTVFDLIFSFRTAHLVEIFKIETRGRFLAFEKGRGAPVGNREGLHWHVYLFFQNGRGGSEDICTTWGIIHSFGYRCYNVLATKHSGASFINAGVHAHTVIAGQTRTCCSSKKCFNGPVRENTFLFTSTCIAAAKNLRAFMSECPRSASIARDSNNQKCSCHCRQKKNQKAFKTKLSSFTNFVASNIISSHTEISQVQTYFKSTFLRFTTLKQW